MRRTLAAVVVALLAGHASPSAQSPSPSRTRHAVAGAVFVTSPAVAATEVGTAKAGAALQIGACANGWCEVTGVYIAERQLTPTAPAAMGLVMPTPSSSKAAQPPPGATAQCRDGSYSVSRTRSGTCSHHGGVARWY